MDMFKHTFQAFICSFLCSTLTFAQTTDGIDLSDLMFSENWFSDLDEAVAQADKVYYLDLSLQKKREFPEQIFQFKNLQKLFLSYNYYASIPDRIGELHNLRLLDLSGNYYMNTLPEGLWELQSLERLIIEDHKLIPSTIEEARKKLPHTKIITD